MRPNIALSMRVVSAAGYNEPRDAISHDWVVWLERNGYCPVLIPNVLNDVVGWLTAVRVDGVVLTGGNDVMPRPDQTDDTAPVRDDTENAILDFAIERKVPTLGVCRGMQIINRYFGGTVTADITEGKTSGHRHVRNDHTVEFREPFVTLVGERAIETNSFHDQGVSPEQVAPVLNIVANCKEDGLVEAIAHPTLPILAMQWHPERPLSRPDIDSALIKRLFAESKFWDF